MQWLTDPKNAMWVASSIIARLYWTMLGDRLAAVYHVMSLVLPAYIRMSEWWWVASPWISPYKHVYMKRVMNATRPVHQRNSGLT